MKSIEVSAARPQPMRADLPIGNDPHSIRRRIEAMERVLEHGFTVPGTNYQFGLDAIVGLIPVIGDFIGAVLGSYLIWEAKNLGLPKWKLWRMAGNVAFDTGIGFVPVVGDAMDFLFRSNSRNLKIVKRHLDKHHPETRVIEG
jgi:hypothetical protein